MDCPQCHSPMEPLQQSGLGMAATLIGVATALTGNIPSLGNGFGGARLRCTKCDTEVLLNGPPPGAPPRSVENLEDYRKRCLYLVPSSVWETRLLGGFAPKPPHDPYTKNQRFLRILDAMTLEERLHPDRIGAVERQRITTDSDTTLDDIEQLFKEFGQCRDNYRGEEECAKNMKLADFIPIILFTNVGFLVIIGTGIWAIWFNSVAASVLSFFGYCVVSAVLLFLFGSRVQGARNLVFSSWPRACIFCLVIPGAMATGLYFLLHEHVRRAGIEYVAVILGCVVVAVLVVMIQTILLMSPLGRLIIRNSMKRTR